MRVPALLLGSLALTALGASACGGGSSPTASTGAAPASPAAASASASGPAPSSPPAAASGPASAAGGPSDVTFDGAYSGSVKIDACVGSGSNTTVSLKVSYSGDSHAYTGDSGSQEFGFLGPAGEEFDSGFLNTPLDPNGSGFNFDGIKVTDEKSGKSLTMHGTLHCP